MVIEILVLILWMLYCNSEGGREGVYWHQKFQGPAIKGNEHNIWSLQRFFVWCLCVIAITNFQYFLWTDINVYKPLLLVAMFPAIHDGRYYSVRNMMDSVWLNKHPYPKGFFDQSKTSTAFFTKYMPPVVRIPLVIIAILCYVISQ